MADSHFVGHEPCPACGSRDNLARYSDGHGYCHGCGHYEKSPGETSVAPQMERSSGDFVQGERIDRTIRSIKPETFSFWGYQLGSVRGQTVHLANHYKNGKLVGQKIRTKSKEFSVRGKLEPLYGMWLWGSGNARRVIITEGELDALSVSQAQSNKWPVVSVPNGASGAAKAMAKAAQWLDRFEEVVVMFDNDDPGREAAAECAKILRPGKVRIATLDGKDANELLKDGREADILRAVYNAEVYRPDGIVSLGDIIQDILKPPEYGMATPWPTFTDLTYGKRLGEWWCYGAGVGVGKTDFFTQMMSHDITTNGEKICGIFLEQPNAETGKRLAGKVDKKLYHIPDTEFDPEQLESTLRKISDKVYLYNHFGSQDWDTIAGLIRFMYHAYGVRYYYLDHLTALAAHAEDERRYLDKLCAELSSLCQELNIHIDVVSHLTTPKGEAHEEGGRVKEMHFTGSRAIARWAHYMIGLERNKQAEDETERHQTTVRILKDRYTGRATGKIFKLGYDQATGHLYEVASDSVDEAFKENEDIGF